MQVSGCSGNGGPASGTINIGEFASLTGIQATFGHDANAGQRSYRTQYAFHPRGRGVDTTIIIEEEGVSSAGPLGEPGLLTGVMRIITGRSVHEEQLRLDRD